MRSMPASNALVAVGDLVSEIRELHPMFIDSKKFSEGQILRLLTRHLNDAVGRLTDFSPDAAAIEGRITEGERVAALDLDNRGRHEVAPFRTIIDSARIEVNAAGAEEKVELVAFATQYPGPYQDSITFPAMALGNAVLRFTDLRRAGFVEHGWDQFSGPIRYDYVPYFNLALGAGEGGTTEAPGPDPEEGAALIELTPGIREPVIFGSGMELAKWAGLRRLSASLESRYDLGINQVIAQASNIAVAPGAAATQNIGGF